MKPPSANAILGSSCVWPRCAESKKIADASNLDSTNPKRWLKPGQCRHKVGKRRAEGKAPGTILLRVVQPLVGCALRSEHKELDLLSLQVTCKRVFISFLSGMRSMAIVLPGCHHAGHRFQCNGPGINLSQGTSSTLNSSVHPVLGILPALCSTAPGEATLHGER